MNERIKELALQAGINSPDRFKLTVNHMATFRLEKFAALVAAHEREACLKIIDNYEIPVGNSRAGEISCGMTYGALKDIHDAIRARGTT